MPLPNHQNPRTINEMQKSTILYGILTGIGTAVYLLIFYKLDRENAINPFVSFGSLLVVVAGMVLASRKLRDLNDGKLTKQEALKASFLVAVISGLFFYGLLYVLFQKIDSGLNELVRQKMQATAKPGDSIPAYEMSLGDILMGYGFSLIYGFLLALRVSNFVKK